MTHTALKTILNNVCETDDTEDQGTGLAEKPPSPRDVLDAFNTIWAFLETHDDDVAMDHLLQSEERCMRLLHGKAKLTFLAIKFRFYGGHFLIVLFRYNKIPAIMKFSHFPANFVIEELDCIPRNIFKASRRRIEKFIKWQIQQSWWNSRAVRGN